MNFSDEYRLHCLAQHFAVWFEDIKNDRLPDFGSPCQGCKNQKVCHELGYPWLDILGPVLQDAGVQVRLIQSQLSHVLTKDLVSELQRREGVETTIAEPYQDVQVKASGPAIVLVVMD